MRIIVYWGVFGPVYGSTQFFGLQAEKTVQLLRQAPLSVFLWMRALPEADVTEGLMA